jgi:hypothetical protein
VLAAAVARPASAAAPSRPRSVSAVSRNSGSGSPATLRPGSARPVSARTSGPPRHIHLAGTAVATHAAGTGPLDGVGLLVAPVAFHARPMSAFTAATTLSHAATEGGNGSATGWGSDEDADDGSPHWGGSRSRRAPPSSAARNRRLPAGAGGAGHRAGRRSPAALGPPTGARAPKGQRAQAGGLGAVHAARVPGDASGRPPRGAALPTGDRPMTVAATAARVHGAAAAVAGSAAGRGLLMASGGPSLPPGYSRSSVIGHAPVYLLAPAHGRLDSAGRQVSVGHAAFAPLQLAGVTAPVHSADESPQRQHTRRKVGLAHDTALRAAARP